MTDEKKITVEGSLSYEEFCERLSSTVGADLMYTHDVLGRVGLEVLWLKLSNPPKHIVGIHQISTHR
jgi:hypothetical protein